MLTPLMKQYWEIKSLHMDKILFFRMGDFFELFHDDAIRAAPLLGIALTSRNRKAADETPMCGVPHLSVPGQINKLLRHGLKVALCDQVEDAAVAKGLVKRAVTRILSPGMVYDPENLEGGCANYLSAFDFPIVPETSSEIDPMLKGKVAFVDVTTGEAFYYHLQLKDLGRMFELFRPVEVVMSEGQRLHWDRYRKGTSFDTHVTCWGGVELDAKDRLREYAILMQGEELRETLPAFEKREGIKLVDLGTQTLRHLEVFQNYRGETKGSLLSIIDKTKTSGGARFLRYWLSTPTTDRTLLADRHDQVSHWMNKMADLKEVRDRLRTLGDIERRIMKIASPSCNPRDIVSLALSLQVADEIYTRFLDGAHPLLGKLANSVLDQFKDEPPVSTRDAGIFKAGVDRELDELIQLTEDTDGALLAMETRERERTKIPSLKIRYNNVFGYYIEITHSHKDRVPEDYQRKQTLANAERFVTAELLQLEHKVLAARSKRESLEYEMFVAYKGKVLTQIGTLLSVAHRLSELDVLTSFAWLALEQRYVRPMFTDASEPLRIISSRHPVVEQLVSVPFVANDIHLEKGHCLLLTGPNMAGKSTLMRQVALTSLLAQVGCFVPAREARLPIFKALLTRIGSSDALWEGLSTFMVEMTETAELLKRADSDTLVILDEIGRGTSTFDGMSLAQAILEELALQVRPTTFFATHYHELTEQSRAFPSVHAAHMSLREQRDDISFLYTLAPGPANKSFGIQVGKKAGLPARVVARAQKILSSKENQQLSLWERSSEQTEASAGRENQHANQHEIHHEIAGWKIENLSPLEVFKKVHELQLRMAPVTPEKLALDSSVQ